MVTTRSESGAPATGADATHLQSPLVPEPSASPPAPFERAVASLDDLRPRRELVVRPLKAPQKMAPFSWATTVEADIVHRGDGTDDLDEPDTSGRLILLHDPAGQEAWEGTFRLVCFVQARLEREQLGDEMLPVIAWSWLTEALDGLGADHRALGGTVTQTSSVRFGDIAGPNRDDDVELRASWTPTRPDGDLSAHGEAFHRLVATAAGLPPVGVRTLAERSN
jgi:hypothetical protein